MQLTFLGAAVPLSKTLSFKEGRYETSHYPMVRKVTSHTENVENMEQFEAAIRAHAEQNHALMMGGFKRALIDESRANLSDKNAKHQWVCFDFDKVPFPPTIEGAVDAIYELLPEECHDVDAVIQLSPSSFRPDTTTLSCHVFMLLDAPMTTRELKNYLLALNLGNARLRDSLALTDSKSALHYKLDPCVADNSRIIYIAPPKLKGFKNDGINWLDRLEGTKRTLVPSGTHAFPRAELDGHVQRLREAEGLERQTYTYTKLHGDDVLKGVGELMLTELRTSGNHYLRFNLNGGDSLAYYIDLHKPDVIGNFKGEPFMRTCEVAPELYKQLQKSTRNMPAENKASDTVDVLAFYATNHGSKLYVGTYDRGADKLRVDPSNETAATAFLKQYGVPLRSTLPHFDLVYDVASNHRYEEEAPVINMYRRTDFMKQFEGIEPSQPLDETMEELDSQCPVIMKFLRSITGDPRSAEVFVNWLAYIFRYRVKTGTAWVLWGTEGSGKGKFLEHVCQPLFGTDNVAQVLFSNIDQNFNSLLEGKLIVNIDEAAMSKTRDKVETMSKLRNWITEPNIVINTKNVTERSVPSFSNFIISSNDFRPVSLNHGDRRYHVGSRQETRLLPTANEFATLVQGTELPHFAENLAKLIIDEELVRNPELTEQKQRLFEATHSLVDACAIAIMNKDTNFFYEARPNGLPGNGYDALAPIKQYDDLLRCMANQTFNVARFEDLFVLFTIVVNDDRFFPKNATMQRQLFTRFGLLADPDENYIDKRTGEAVNGVLVGPWKRLGKAYKTLLPEISSDGKVIALKR